MNIFSEVNQKRISWENSFFSLMKHVSLPLARMAFFIVFFWFGLLKMIGRSPAEGVVYSLYEHTVPFVPWPIFIFFFGAYEMLIGVVFLFRGKEKWALYLLVPHMITTFGPLIILPKLVWKGFLVPNLIGQYIIKNLVIIALAIFIAAYVWEEKSRENGKKITAADGDLVQSPAAAIKS